MKLALLLALLCTVAVTASSANLARRGTLGGVEKIDDLESDEVQKAAQAAVSDLNSASDSEFKLVLMKVTEGTVQMVAGKKYVLTIVVGKSMACKKESTSDNCPVIKNSLQTLTATVVYHPWYTPVYEIVSIEAAEAGTQYSRKVGAPETLKDLHDSYVIGAAEVAVTELNRRSNSLYKLVLIEVLHGTSQVVNGVKYVLALQVGMSTECKNDGRTATTEQCPVLYSTADTWQAVVWQHPTTPPQYDLLELDKLP